MARVELSRAALEAAARARARGSGYREIARELYRRRLVDRVLNPGTVWSRLTEARLAARVRRRAVRKEDRS